MGTKEKIWQRLKLKETMTFSTCKLREDLKLNNMITVLENKTKYNDNKIKISRLRITLHCQTCN